VIVDIDYNDPKSIAYSEIPLQERLFYLKNYSVDKENEINKLKNKKEKKPSPQFKLLLFILLYLISQNLTFMICLFISYIMIRTLKNWLSFNDPEKPDTKDKRTNKKDLEKQKKEADKFIKNLRSVL
jgi:hypothetical protein